MHNKISYSIFVVLMLMLLSIILSGFVKIFTIEEDFGGNVLIIPITGVLSTQEVNDIIGMEITSSTKIIKSIKQAAKDPRIKAVVFEIDSGGGGAVASQEIVSEIKKLNKTKIAVIRSMGASGAYWIASATDYIFANPLSMVGSIGAISSYLDFSGLLHDYNITYERLVSAPYKDMGSPFKELTPEERQIFERQLKLVHEFFLTDVAENRHINLEKMRELATGQLFLGQEAYSLGLVDALGNLDDAKLYLENLLNISVKYKYLPKEKTLAELLGLNKYFAFNLGKGLASSYNFKETLNTILRLT